MLTPHVYWNRCSDFRVVDEDGEEVLEHFGKTGIVLRRQDVRRYYLLCIDALNKLILYRREDDIYYPFAFQVGVFCTHRY